MKARIGEGPSTIPFKSIVESRFLKSKAEIGSGIVGV
jgi:hypothetical protein